MKPHYETEHGSLYHGNALDVLKSMTDESVQCCVTSPPYWGLRDYGVDGQLGLEKTPEEYIEKMVEIFREVRRVIRDDGCMFLNLGDSYASSGTGNNGNEGYDDGRANRTKRLGGNSVPGLKPKDLCGIPWRVALALQADGWYLRSAMPWVKRSAMPESCTDRPASALEYMFLRFSSSKTFQWLGWKCRTLFVSWKGGTKARER